MDRIRLFLSYYSSHPDTKEHVLIYIRVFKTEMVQAQITFQLLSNVGIAPSRKCSPFARQGRSSWRSPSLSACLGEPACFTNIIQLDFPCIGNCFLKVISQNDPCNPIEKNLNNVTCDAPVSVLYINTSGACQITDTSWTVKHAGCPLVRQILNLNVNPKL